MTCCLCRPFSNGGKSICTIIPFKPKRYSRNALAFLGPKASCPEREAFLYPEADVDAYDPQAIETKWQEVWEAEKAFYTPDPEPGTEQEPKFYMLEMLPYPSGALHIATHGAARVCGRAAAEVIAGEEAGLHRSQVGSRCALHERPRTPAHRSRH